MKRCKLRTESRLVIVLDSLEFSYYEHDLKRAKKLWESGACFEEMVKKLRGRGIDARYETALIILHLLRENEITLRRGEIKGLLEEVAVN